MNAPTPDRMVRKSLLLAAAIALGSSPLVAAIVWQGLVELEGRRLASATPPASRVPHAEDRRKSIHAIDLDELTDGCRVVPAMRDGRPIGIKLFSIRQNSLPWRLGLRNGDTLRSVAGLPLRSPDEAIAAWRHVQHLDHWDLEIDRNGQPVWLGVAAVRDGSTVRLEPAAPVQPNSPPTLPSAE